VPTLTLTKVWINLLATGVGISAQSKDRTPAYRKVVEVKHLAGGRQRAISIDGEQGSFSFTLVDVPMTDILTLREWVAQAVLVRDHRGQSFYGVFDGLSLAEKKDKLDLYDVALTVRVLTVDEGI